jgi:predicted dienelactone hydrolase
VARWLIAVAVAAWAPVAAAAPAARLPAPDGRYAVGVVRSEFVDRSRRLDADDPASGPRRLPAIVWYPAAGRRGGDVAYMTAAEAAATAPAVARNMRWTEDEVQAMKTARVAARARARPAQRPGGFPIVLFSHGFFLYPQQNSALASRLASHGYIVVSIAHPGDAADVPLADGRVVATRIAKDDAAAQLGRDIQALAEGADLASVRAALKDYGDDLARTRFGRSLAAWRDDTLAVASAIVDKNAPRDLSDVLAAGDRSRLAFAGMSFGGATAATTCKLVEACRAAVNLDGQNFDPDLFDRPVGRPLLMLLSDWTRYALFKDQRRDEDYSPNDLAFEPWRKAGEDRDLVRVRLQGARHVGFTDLVELMRGPKRDERVGDISGGAALAAVGDVVLAFLDAYVRGGDPDAIDRAIRRHPALARHVPSRLQHWMSASEAARQR